MKPNSDIQNLIKVYGFRSYQIADKLGCHENTLYRMLRKELDPKQKQQIYGVLELLKAERETEISKINSTNEIPTL